MTQHKKLKTDLSLVREDGLYLRKIDPTKLTRKIVLEAVKQNGYALEFAREYKNDLEIALAAVNQKTLAYTFAGEELKKKVEFLTESKKTCDANPGPGDFQEREEMEEKKRREKYRMTFEVGVLEYQPSYQPSYL